MQYIQLSLSGLEKTPKNKNLAKRRALPDAFRGVGTDHTRGTPPQILQGVYGSQPWLHWLITRGLGPGVGSGAEGDGEQRRLPHAAAVGA